MIVSLNGGWQLQQSESQYNYALPLNFHAIYCQFFIITYYTDWLQLKYSTGQNAISRQRCEIFISKFLGLYGRDPATILNLKKKYFSFLQSYDYISVFNFPRNNQQQLVIFIVQKH